MIKMLTLDKFEEASEKVKEVTLETKLVYSEYLSGQSGNKVYLKPENLQYTKARATKCAALIRSAHFPMRKEKKGADHGICRKPCAGRCLRGKMLWCQGSDRYADDDTNIKVKPHQRDMAQSGSFTGMFMMKPVSMR